MARIGLMGGSFDPPHLAHLALARTARDELALDEVRWMPAGQPWQKHGRTLAAGEHRAAMTARLIDNEPGFVLDRREIDRSGPTYTVDTVRELIAELPGAECVLLLGQDQYARLNSWRDWRELLLFTTLAVAAREGLPLLAPPALLAVPHRMEPIHLPRMDISSTDIRRRVAAGLPIAPLVGVPVASYIDQHHLYRAQPGS